MSEIIDKILLVFIVAQLGLITWMMVGIMKAIVDTKQMVHDHVHGITNYLAESTSELRMMRMGKEMECTEEIEDHKDHGHHHN